MLRFFGLANLGPITNKDQLNKKIDEVKLNEETIKELFGNLLSQHVDTEIITLIENFHFQPIINQLKEKQQVKIQFNPFNVRFVYLLALAILKQDYPEHLIVLLAQDITPDPQSEKQLNYLTTSIQETTPYFNPDLARLIATTVLDQLKASNEKLSNESHSDNTDEQQPEELQQAEADIPHSSVQQPLTLPPPPPPLPQGDIKLKTHATMQTAPIATKPDGKDKKPSNTDIGFVPLSATDLQERIRQLKAGELAGTSLRFRVTKSSGKRWPDPTAPQHPKPPIETPTQPPTTGGVDNSPISREQQFAAARAVFSQKAQALSHRVTTLDSSLATKPIKKVNPAQDLRINKFTKLTGIADLYMRIIGEEDDLGSQLMEKKIAFYQKLGKQERQLTPLAPNATEECRLTWLKEHQTEIKRAQQFQTDALFQADLFNPFIEEKITPILRQMYTKIKDIKENANTQELIEKIKTIVPDICVDAENTSAPKPT